jgi:glyoxylase-like metal-dependent hydrolase (beta-lactamase superfamily II)
MLRWRVGDATVIRVPELDAAGALEGLIPRLDLASISGDAWLRPHFVDEAGNPRGLVQAFVILMAGYTIMVDSGVGNGKRRVAVSGWDDLHTDFLSRLQTAGVAPGEVDYVVNTHLHFDHVGWHTKLVGGAWRPTFPAARYVMSAGEFGYWQSKPQNEIDDQHAGFADSVLPIYEAGLVDLVADDHVVIDGMRLIPTPGHTPHHVSVLIESGGQSAVITGDVAHHPCQLAHPDWASASDFDAHQARASRSHLVERFAETEALIIGSHFADPVAGRLRREDGAICLALAAGAAGAI